MGPDDLDGLARGRRTGAPRRKAVSTRQRAGAVSREAVEPVKPAPRARRASRRAPGTESAS